jgi:hypothetical protein
MRFVYIDETGSGGIKHHPILRLAAVIVDEEMVQPLSEGLRKVASEHGRGWHQNFEFHGKDIWHGLGEWSGKTPPELIAAYEAALALLDTCNVRVAYSSISKPNLSARYDGGADGNVYQLALQFLLEKIDLNILGLKVVVADEAKEYQLRAVRMVADMQVFTGGGEVPGPKIKSIIDTLHYVSSHASPGVQMADLVAFILQRRVHGESDSRAQAALNGLSEKISDHTVTWRDTWP